ncbi:Histidine kinase [Cyclobacterium lianum]|uniref:Histidine kinase n=1 Tax=Cyclobacterium lianum TaxID=388280 RepID=A0A1M7LZP2_9BACT|nr:histidine kinase [Cyclobacterium lianum]SHM83835.1 Histidine kinase [Cyclobacterium lianum]
MDQQLIEQHKGKGEFIFQVILHTLVFSFYTIDRHHPDVMYTFETYHFVFFINYAWANLLISYVCLPHLFYAKKYALFTMMTILVVAMVILIEEMVLERWFFPDSRGTNFPGVIFSLGQVLPILAILSGFKFAWDALLKQRQLDELTAMVKESELAFLKSQINPHFLFNNLNNLYAYAVEGSRKTPEIILELSGVLRYMLYECKEASVPLAKEIDHLRNFTQLYTLQIEDRGEVFFHADIDGNDFRIAPLILNVFVENAFKHSQSGQADKIQIAIHLGLKENGWLHFTCGNNYIPENNNSGRDKGIGLENVCKRLDLLYPGSHELHIDQTDDKYQVSLSIQLRKK